jgi:hypothetical protein
VAQLFSFGLCMSTRLPSLLLAAVAVVASYVVLVVGDLVPRFFQVTFKLKQEEVAGFMSHPTRFATASSWVFVVAVLLALSVALLLFRLHPGHMVRVTVATLCVQGVIVWITFFCYCYDAFCGPMSLHHGPEFDPAQFFRFEVGVFPATLLFILIPLAGCFVRRSPSSVGAEPGAAPNGGPASHFSKPGLTEGPPSVS